MFEGRSRSTISASRTWWRVWEPGYRLLHRRGLVGRDPLTGLGTRRQGERLLRRDLARGNAGAVVVCEIDHFMRFNLANGHLAGDELLVLVAAVLTSAQEPRRRGRSRPRGYRIGGDEFLVRLPCGNEQTARAFAELARVAIKDLPVQMGAETWEESGRPWPLTARFAVAGWTERGAPSFDDLSHALQEALYQSSPSPDSGDSVTSVSVPRRG